MAAAPPANVRSTAGLILSDSPWMGADDPLGFDRHAEKLVGMVLASRESAPFTVSIEGGWGTGKSTLMRRMQQRFEPTAGRKRPKRDRNVRTVWFNAWSTPQDAVPEALVRVLLDELSPRLLRRIARRRRLIRGLRLASTVASGALGFGGIADSIWNRVAHDPKALNELGDLVNDAMREWLKGRERKGGGLVVVFIDDLDRCTASAIMKTFESIKVHLNAPGIVFVVGWDTDMVTRAVGADIGTDDRLPQRYVEKIVQLGFRIPKPSDEQLEGLTDALMERARLDDEVFDDTHRDLLARATGGNPRQIKRLINRFILLDDPDEQLEGIDPSLLTAVRLYLVVLHASYDELYRELAKVEVGAIHENPLVEFSDYLRGRTAARNHMPGDVIDILRARGIPFDESESAPDLFALLEASLSSVYPALAVDADLTALIEAMTPDEMEALWRYAHSSAAEEIEGYEVFAGDGSGSMAATKMGAPPIGAPAYRAAEPVVPGTRVVWIDDHPKKADHAVLPQGVRLTTAVDLDDARRELTRAGGAAVLVSDMRREDDDDAGLVDLEAIRTESLHDGPVVFYTSRPTSGQVDRAAELGADVATNASELNKLLQLHLAEYASPSGSTSEFAS